MSDNSALSVNWNQLLGKLAGKNGFNPKFSSVTFATVSNSGRRIDYISPESRGKRILEHNAQKMTGMPEKEREQDGNPQT